VPAHRAAQMALALGAVVLAGCGRADDQRTVRGVAEGFYAAVKDHQGARACAWLSPDARTALEQQESKPCASAVVDLKLSGRRAADVRVYVTEGAVDLAGGDTVFLEDTKRGWRISAAGCTTHGVRQPADCELAA
jgi:hypothetical protein